MRTYIASGNVLFDSRLDERSVISVLERRVADVARKLVGVLVRTTAEMAQVVVVNPFVDEPGNRVVVVFLSSAPFAPALTEVAGRMDERLVLSRREIYVHYGDGMADSRRRIPTPIAGTTRSMNTVAKLAGLAAK